MSEELKYLQIFLAVMVIVIGIVVAGCSTGSAGQTGSQEQPVATPAASTSTTDTPASTTGTQPNNGWQNGDHTGQPGGPDMSKMMSRAAEILGITEAQLTSAFQQAQESVFGKMPGGMPGRQPPSDSSGQRPPHLYTDNSSGQRPPQLPSGTSGQQPPQWGQGPNSGSTQKLYSKMAEILSISADKIASAMDQARQELQSAVK